MRKQKLKALLVFGSIIAIIVLITFRNTFGFIIVEGDSMRPTYHDGQIVFISKTSKSFSVDDIVVFSNADEIQIKRIVGLPGDCIRLFEGKIYRNGMILHRYLVNNTIDITYDLSDIEYFVIGDDYQNSKDSIDYGAIEEIIIIGRAIH